MKKSEIKELPEDFKPYVNLNEDIELEEAFNKSLQQIEDLDIDRLNRIGLKAYDEGKWSIHKIIQHLIDWERIWCYRSVIVAHREGSILEGHDQEIMGKYANADELSIEQLITELKAVRLATQAMFQSFNREILETKGRFFNYEASVLALGFGITGHQLHHFKVIEERYYPLDN